MKEFKTIFVGFVWLLTFVAVHGKNQVGLDVVIDPHCSQVKNESAIIINKAIKELEARQEVAVTYYCNEGCFQNYHVDECKNSQNASTPTYKLVLNVSKPVPFGKVIKEFRTVTKAYCMKTKNARTERHSECTWIPLPTHSPLVQITVQPAEKDDNLWLKVGLPVALAALAAAVGAGLLYRKLRKKNEVGDESDTSGILGGTPVTTIDDAPNSTAPAGTS